MDDKRDPKTDDKTAPGLYGTTRNRNLDNSQPGQERTDHHHEPELKKKPEHNAGYENSNDLEGTELQENPPQENDGRFEDPHTPGERSPEDQKPL